ncbi:MAG TPA: AMP-dependent synthetase, partial [Sulfitobacter pontiacus]|nr:AMP-dependent synthetase [Sulfitobacter pontiacus]
MAQTSYFDSLETRSPETRAADLARTLPAQIARAQALPGYAGSLDGVAPDTITNVEALAALPVLRKSEIGKQQAQSAPFGGFTTKPAHAFTHIFQSPGPIYEPSSDAP